MIMGLYDIIKKLNGNIRPVGSHETDMQNFNNLQEYCITIRKMIDDLVEVAKNKNRAEYSMKVMGEEAYEAIKEVHEMTYTK